MVRPVISNGGFMRKFAFDFNGRCSKRTFTLDFNGGGFCDESHLCSNVRAKMKILTLRQCLCNVDNINTCMFIVYSLCWTCIYVKLMIIIKFILNRLGKDHTWSWKSGIKMWQANTLFFVILRCNKEADDLTSLTLKWLDTS